jgi:hypothetical protein
VADERTAPRGVDVSTPNVARMWDYQLGGKDNFAADRQAADALNKAITDAGAPDGRVVARENRGFVHRAVRYLAEECGVRQFLDIGAGLPTQGNVHEIVQKFDPDIRVVYVDYDPVVVAHGRALLSDSARTLVVGADLREPDGVFDHPEVVGFLDFDQPVAVILVAVLHLVPDDDDPAGIVARIQHRIGSGSYLAMTHVTRQNRPAAAATLASEFARLRVTTPIVPRTREEIAGFFAGFELVGPGLVFPAHWPGGAAASGANSEWLLAGVGRKP